MSFPNRSIISIFFAVVVSISVTGCAGLYDVAGDMRGHGEHLIPAPRITSTDALSALKDERIKVSKISVIAPNKGRRLWNGMVNVPRDLPWYMHAAGYVVVDKFYAEYFFKENTHDAIRQGLDYLFEIDPNSEMSVTVLNDLTMKSFQSTMRSCESWQIQIQIQMKLEFNFEWDDGESFKRAHYADSAGNSCPPYPTKFPSTEAVSQVIENAFTSLLLSAQTSHVK